MKSKLYTSAILLFFSLWTTGILAQDLLPSEIIRPIGFDVLDNLSQVKGIEPGYIDRTWKEKVIPNKDGFLEEFKNETFTGPDPVLQNYQTASRTAAAIDKNFDGQVNTSGVAPPDTDGDVSPLYYMQMVNLSFQIFDRNGNSLYGPYVNSTIWSGFEGPWTTTNDGDPIVLYDQTADRWLASQFALPNYPSGPFYMLIAISTSNDPRGGWYRYAYEFSQMPDYPKFGVWPDGYYLTTNRFAPPRLSFAGAGVYALDRQSMLNGNSTAAIISWNLSTTYGSLLPADFDGAAPPAGSPAYFVNLGSGLLRVWKATVNWSSPGSSTLSSPMSLTTQSFSSSNITINQPGTSQTLDPLFGRLMFRLQYRNFGTHESMVCNHTVNAGSGQAGVRWYELRKTTGNWAIYQQGTFAPNDGLDRWMASAAMNAAGDIAIGYSVSGSNRYPSVRFAGRTAGNTLGNLDVAETSIYEGTKSQTGINRWGDYSMMSVDPVDDNTFWYTNEYSNGGWNWKTRIASFNFGEPPVNEDPPVAQFIGSPTSIQVGSSVQFTDQSTNTPTTWSWSFDNGSGTVLTSSIQNPLIQFATEGVYTVSLTAANQYGSDVEVKTGYVTVNAIAPILYCTSTATNANTSDYITKVVVGGVTKTSTRSGYSDFTSIIFPATKGRSVSFSLTPNSNTRKEYWRIWIDYNHDMDFNDSGEQVYAGNNKKGVVNGSFTIPVSSLTGETRIRISMKNGGAPTACETFLNGEVEDYTINIVASMAPVAAVHDQPVGLSELSLDLYPNPAGDEITVKATGNSAKINIKVYNVLGMILKDYEQDGEISKVDLSDYKSGIYFIGADDGIKTALKKFIKE